MIKSNKLTTSAGAPIADNQKALTAGPRGLVLGHFEKVHPDYAAGVRKALAERPKMKSTR